MLPSEMASLLHGRSAHPVTTGESGARVVRYADSGTPALYLKALPLADGTPLGDEAARLRWMAARGVAVAAVRGYAVHDGCEYLLLDEVPGTDAATVAERVASESPTHVADRSLIAAALVHAIADDLRQLHAVPATDCPFRHPARARIAEARERARRGLVDESGFDAERHGRSAEDLVGELESLAPEREAAVLTHGDYCLPNVIVEMKAHDGGAVVSGLIDCGRAGLADPYQDLAIAARSVAWNLGPAWVPALFARYGMRHVDERKLRFYTLLDEFF
jgi:aminoglycoside 3'-phosphotransferase-2